MTKKMSKENFVLLVSFALFVLLCVITASVATFSDRYDASGQITLGELDFSIAEENANDLIVMPSQTIDKVVTVLNSRDSDGKNFAGLCDIFFRFSYQTFLDEVKNDDLKQYIKITALDNFVTDEKQIFYCSNKLQKGQFADICKTIVIDKNTPNEFQNKNITIEFQIDAIQADNNAYLELWQDAPQEWGNIIENLV